MTAPFILISDYSIQPGKQDEFLQGFKEIADLADAGEPRLLCFAEHLSEDGTQGSTVQVHADAENMERHL
jgi:hypothetical protein